jgi:hypothetical protein
VGDAGCGDDRWDTARALCPGQVDQGDGPRVAEDFFEFRDGETIDIEILVVFVGETIEAGRSSGFSARGT